MIDSGGRKNEDETVLIEAINTVSELISISKHNYLTKQGSKLNDPRTNSKAYWAILRRFLNKVKIPEIPPLLVNNTFITDFKSKAAIFNDFFFKTM